MKLCVTDQMQPAGEIRYTRDGFAVFEARIARSGMYRYGDATIYRPESLVFDEANMATFAHRPITIDHPPAGVNVTADNWRELARGTTGGEVKRDGEHVVVPIMLTDSEAIAAVKRGMRGLSAGYSVEIDMTAGVTDSGEAYDGVMVGRMEGNHVALCYNPRAGTFIGDSFPSTQEESVVTTKTITFDGLPLLVTDAAEAAIAKRDAQLADAASALQAAQATIAERDRDLAARDSEIETFRAAQLDAAAIDAMANAKAAVVERARALIGDALGDVTGLSVADVRRAVVKAKCGDSAVDGKSDDYIEARFDTLQGNATGDALRDSTNQSVQDSDSRVAYLARFSGRKGA